MDEVRLYGGIRRWTRHSLVLSVAGLVYIGIGVAFLLAPPQAAQDPSLKVALHWLNLKGWAVVFMTCGLVASSACLWPLTKKTWGYSVLTGLSAGWGAVYAVSVVLGKAPLISLFNSLIWGMLAFVWWAVSGLISPEHLEVIIDDGRDQHWKPPRSNSRR